ncbi:MAG: nucleoside triphosphate pyrophosphohydrolase [Bacteroidetes bacterium]|nr:nucleoside triphosphate pyrophosphohydrolase [Bacteroidota bacterium]
MSNTLEKKKEAFERLLSVMDDLRAQCPWDKKQTIHTLRHLTIEETYELAEAIDENNFTEIKKELGDLLLHIVFYAKIGDEQNAFDIADVCNSLCEKLIVRHPHIYGDVKVKDEEEVKQNWEKIKLQEGNKSVLGGVPNTLPAIIKAMRMQDKAAQVGFDWNNKEEVWEKVEEEMNEFKNASTLQERENELGDLLFSLINYARFEDINPETALEKTNKKFKYRFQKIEEHASTLGKKITDLTIDEMNEIWEKAKGG